MTKEQRANIVKERARQLTWQVSDDLSQSASTPDSVLRNERLMLALMLTLRHLSKVANQDWCDFQTVYREVKSLADLSTRRYGGEWMLYCEMVSAEAGVAVNYGQAMSNFIPAVTPEEFKQLGLHQGYISETKTLTGKVQLVVNQS